VIIRARDRVGPTIAPLLLDSFLAARCATRVEPRGTSNQASAGRVPPAAFDG
jgi:hypothetical protein